MKLRKLSKNQLLVCKIILYICAVIALANIVYFAIKMFSEWPDNYYTKVIMLPLIIFVAGVIALLLPFVSYSTTYSSNVKADNMMVYVGMLAIAISIVTLIFLIITKG